MQQSLQDQYYSKGTCFGCGPHNTEGLQIKSYARDDGVPATWTSSEFHGNGFGFLNGGSSRPAGLSFSSVHDERDNRALWCFLY
ncbi:MAG: hypothetical protein Ct9H300mP16_05940 [Pseudomonadota bacterium]|nr:MAG: hypothetical protein Ct9H300mP16_05940 [Pseudomonadota bacterium]